MAVVALGVGFMAGWLVCARAQAAARAQAEQAMRTVFQALAAEQFDRSSDRFRKDADDRNQAVRDYLSQHKEAVAGLLGPLAEKVKEYDQQRQEMYGRLSNELRRVAEANEKLRAETGSLVNALRRPQVRGRWGESTLRRVVELAGMVPHVDFEEQVSSTTETGRIRPDMIVSMPNGHTVVVDAKVALDAYIQAHEEAAEEKRDTLLARHAQQMRTHAAQLAQKSYWEHLPEATEFVVMFVPGEHFLAAALERDGTLLDDMMQKRVVIATPGTLIALLRAVESGWRTVALEQNAREISGLGRELYARTNVFLSHLNRIQKGLESAVKAFNDAVGSLESKVMPQLRRFKDLRADDGKELAEPEQVETECRRLPAAEEE